MAWHTGTMAGSLALGVALLGAGGPRQASAEKASAPKAPPAPPITVKQFPKPTSRPPVPRIIRLAPGQRVITAAQLRNAPTVYEANRRDKSRVAKPLSRPAPMRIPGAPQILHDLPLPESKPPRPVPVAKKKPATVGAHKK